MQKCIWALASAAEEQYHDQEWGVPLYDDHKLFEFLILEGAQAGLSWRTILNKRDSYRLAFDQFDAQKMAAYDETKLAELQLNPGIIRNRLKIRAAALNAQAFVNIQAQYGSFAEYIWQFVDGKPRQNHWQSHADIPAFSPESEHMSKALTKQGFKFVGKTICYAYMQAVGMVNDHTVTCYRHSQLS
ncbi:DNA-3-methyladenine glycosylase I [Methylomonas paludis]|uniref:DNA-3-methyladenine glycosylase I n=1 Tax=Methylomonas paludis TaxID=1173101 RepID=A0A975R910_9GAMM|nr:DNA-3-methyladenine glycosylase I [Methylomonas paludis]QWF69739.1 DNA-3-methyladenine glycosylase I [Methylomonas paludis]